MRVPRHVGKALESNTILTILSLDGNKVSDENAKALGRVGKSFFQTSSA